MRHNNKSSVNKQMSHIRCGLRQLTLPYASLRYLMLSYAILLQLTLLYTSSCYYMILYATICYHTLPYTTIRYHMLPYSAAYLPVPTNSFKFLLVSQTLNYSLIFLLYFWLKIILFLQCHICTNCSNVKSQFLPVFCQFFNLSTCFGYKDSSLSLF